MHLNKRYPKKKHHFITKMNHDNLHLPRCNRCNFAMQTLFNLPIISRLMQSLYGYSSKSPKSHLEFTKLTSISKTKDNKILWNVKTWRILMFSLWRIFFENIGPFDEDGFKCSHCCLGYLKSQSIMWICFLSLVRFISMFGIVNSLMKFVQLYDVFVWLCGNIEYLSNWFQVVCQPHFGFQWLIFWGFTGWWKPTMMTYA
jgi:hypothetical protein